MQNVLGIGDRKEKFWQLDYSYVPQRGLKMHLELRDISRNKNSAKILELKITQGHRRRRQENTRHGHQEKKEKWLIAQQLFDLTQVLNLKLQVPSYQSEHIHLTRK